MIHADLYLDSENLFKGLRRAADAGRALALVAGMTDLLEARFGVVRQVRSYGKHPYRETRREGRVVTDKGDHGVAALEAALVAFPELFDYRKFRPRAFDPGPARRFDSRIWAAAFRVFAGPNEAEKLLVEHVRRLAPRLAAPTLVLFGGGDQREMLTPLMDLVDVDRALFVVPDLSLGTFEQFRADGLYGRVPPGRVHRASDVEARGRRTLRERREAQLVRGEVAPGPAAGAPATRPVVDAAVVRELRRILDLDPAALAAEEHAVPAEQEGRRTLHDARARLLRGVLAPLGPRDVAEVERLLRESPALTPLLRPFADARAAIAGDDGPGDLAPAETGGD